jgi:hypothetical protein
MSYRAWLLGFSACVFSGIVWSSIPHNSKVVAPPQTASAQDVALADTRIDTSIDTGADSKSTVDDSLPTAVAPDDRTRSHTLPALQPTGGASAESGAHASAANRPSPETIDSVTSASEDERPGGQASMPFPGALESTGELAFNGRNAYRSPMPRVGGGFAAGGAPGAPGGGSAAAGCPGNCDMSSSQDRSTANGSNEDPGNPSQSIDPDDPGQQQTETLTLTDADTPADGPPAIDTGGSESRQPVQVPEPGSLTLMIAGLAAAYARRRKIAGRS